MKRTITIFLFITVSLVSKAQIDSALSAQLQNVLNTTLTYGNHGVSAHLIMSNGQTWSGVAGVNHQNNPITDTTLFNGASTTKLNIAILMLMLQEDSLIDLDDSWNKYVSLNVAFDTSITIRQLLNHTSGIADYLETPSSGSNITSNFSYFYTPQYILENIVSGVPVFSAGTNFQYSSSNYVLAGLIAEAVTGNSIQTELRTRIWQPLGMNHTYFGAYETFSEPTAGIWWDFGSGLTNYSTQPTTSMLSYGYGGANIVTCPKDLSILLHTLFKNNLLHSQSLNEMLTFVPKSFSSWTKGYGLGIHHFPKLNDTVLGHDGNYTNLTDVAYSKKCGFTLTTMTNTQTNFQGIFNLMYNVLSNYCKANNVSTINDNIDFNIFPNPASHKLIIDYELKNNNKIVQFEIYNMLGAKIQSFDLVATKTKETIDISLLKSGIYFYNVVIDNKIARSDKIVILK